jgi:hypothetical protein
MHTVLGWSVVVHENKIPFSIAVNGSWYLYVERIRYTHGSKRANRSFATLLVHEIVPLLANEVKRSCIRLFG